MRAPSSLPSGANLTTSRASMKGASQSFAMMRAERYSPREAQKSGVASCKMALPVSRSSPSMSISMPSSETMPRKRSQIFSNASPVSPRRATLSYVSYKRSVTLVSPLKRLPGADTTT